jgi:hypothetical protein
MSVHLGMYDYNQTFYSGTDAQPDVLSIFITPEKDTEGLIGCNAIPLQTWVGISPIASIFCAARINNSVKIIFNNLSNLSSLKEDAQKAELWNAFKNLFQGIVEMIPLTGIALIIFESVRMSVYFGKAIETVKDQENIAGIAIDGKVVFTIDLCKLDSMIENPIEKFNEYRLELFKSLCFEFLKKSEERGHNIGMSKLLPKLSELTCFQTPSNDL